MQSELEKTQLEIAKVQLAQEQLKLAQLQGRQKIVDELSQGATTLSGAAVDSGSALIRYAGRWIVYLLLSVISGFFLLLMFTKPFDHPGGFQYGIGFALGKYETPIFISLLLTPTLAAFFPIPKKEINGNLQGLFLAVPLVVFTCWYFFR